MTTSASATPHRFLGRLYLLLGLGLIVLGMALYAAQISLKRDLRSHGICRRLASLGVVFVP